MGCRVIPPCLQLETNRRHPLSLAGGGTITACQQSEGLSSLTPTSVPPRCGTVTTTPGPSTKCCANGSTPARAPEQMAVPGVVRCWRLRVYDLLPIAPRRTRSRGHRAAAAPWRPWAILEHPTPRLPSRPRHRKRSLKLTPAPLGGPGTGRASDQAAPCQSAGRPSIPAGVAGALAGPPPMFAIPGSPPLQLAVAPRLASCNAAGDQDQGAGGVLGVSGVSACGPGLPGAGKARACGGRSAGRPASARRVWRNSGADGY